MDDNKKITRRFTLNALPDKVWDALTNPEQTRKYMFNCSVNSTWQVGSSITWQGNFEGYESGERGVILECEPEKKMKYSSIDPNFGIEMLPENYLHITYNLNRMDEQTELVMTIENFNQDKERLNHVSKGWDTIIIPAIKKLFDTGI